MIDEKEMDIGIRTEVEWGPTCRVYIGYWGNWGIEYGSPGELAALKRISNDSYVEEYSGSTGKRMKNISLVAEASSKQDLPYLMNERNADVVSDLVLGLDDEVIIADLGAGNGNTTVMTYETLLRKWQEHGYLKSQLRDKVFFFLEDPSEVLLEEAARRLSEMGVRAARVHGSAHDTFHPNTIHIAMSVGSLHHYCDPNEPFANTYRILKPGGYFIDSDWFNSLYRNPRSLRKILESCDWSSKTEDMERFDKRFIEGREFPDLEDPEEIAANREMLGYFIKRVGQGAVYKAYMLEGFCPVGVAMDHVRKVGFDTEPAVIGDLRGKGIINGNPHNFQQSTLIKTFIAQKRKVESGLKR